jgi:hypothetical protein
MLTLGSLLTHADTVLTVAVSAHALAIAIVNLTPTPKDDKIVKRAYTVIEAAAGIFTHKAKQK